MSQLAAEAACEADARARKEALIIAAYGQNQSLRDIAHTADLSHEQVRRILMKHGVQVRGRGRTARPTQADA